MNTETKVIKYGFGKFKNIMGVTCYMNSILHILQQTPYFVEWIGNAKFKDIIKSKEDVKKFVIFELFKLFKNSLENDDAPIIPSSFKELIGKKNDQWAEPNHQDSQEFFNWLISQLEEEAGTKTIYIPGLDIKDNMINFQDSIKNIMSVHNTVLFHKREWSIMKELFNGLQQNYTRCSICNSESFDYQPFVTLSVSIPVKDKFDTKEFTLKECIEHSMKEEQLDSDNKITCSMCGFSNKSYRSCSIWSSPKILVIQIKRFIVNGFGIATTKLTNKINYDFENLDISPWIEKSSPYNDKCSYNLFGINIHQSFGFKGNTNYGHYTSMVKSNIDNNWYSMNDSNPIQIIRKKEYLINPDAYLLFYFRTN